MIDTHYPASRDPIDLSMAGVTLADSDPDYFPLAISLVHQKLAVREWLVSRYNRYLEIAQYGDGEAHRELVSAQNKYFQNVMRESN